MQQLHAYNISIIIEVIEFKSYLGHHPHTAPKKSSSTWFTTAYCITYKLQYGAKRDITIAPDELKIGSRATVR
jgi:hypothetical protein